MSTEQQQASPVPASIHPGTHIGLVTLRVSNLEHSRHFYEDILAFQPIEHTSAKVVLGGQDKQPLLALVELPGAAPQPRRATGLHHVAILLPTRADLGRQLLRLARVHWQHYQEDHLVSEALYISDPDGNGLEMYSDRPKECWRWTNGIVEGWLKLADAMLSRGRCYQQEHASDICTCEPQTLKKQNGSITRYWASMSPAIFRELFS